MRWLMILTAAVAVSGAQAQVYKCSEGGTTVFSDVPCAKGRGKEIAVRPATGAAPAAEAIDATPNSSSNPKAMLEQYEQARKLRAIDFEIEQIERDLERDPRKLDAELKALRNKKMWANNNLAGATWESSISQEMQAVTQRYETKAASDRARLEKLRGDRASLLGR